MRDRLPRPLEIQGEVVLALAEAAIKGAKALAAAGPARKRPRRGQTLKPGLDTPMWNALVAALVEQFKRRGERVHLARVLGLPRQRVTEMLRSQSILPDAERTLILLMWLHARRNGQDLA